MTNLRRHRFLKRAYLVGVIGAAFAYGGNSAPAQTWNVNAGGSWQTASNWTSDPTIPGGISASVGLTFNITAATPITLDAPVTLGALTIGDTNASHTYTLSDGTGGSLVFDNGGSAASLTELSTGLSDVVSATIFTVGDLNIDNLNTSGGRTFTLSGPLSSSAVSGTQLVTLNQANGNAAIALNGAITNGGTGGTIALSKTGAGTLTINQSASVSNTFSGGFSMSAGAVIGDSANVVAGTGVSVGSNPFGTGKITISGGTFGPRHSGDGTTAAQTLIYGNDIDLNGNATFDPWRSNAATAATSKVLQFGKLTVNGSNTLSMSGASNSMRFESGAELNGNFAITGVTGKTTTLTINGITETGGARSFSLANAGTSALTVNFVGAGSYTGGTTITGSSLIAQVDGALGTGAIQMTGGVLQLRTAATLGATNTLALSGGTLQLRNNAATSFASGAISLDGNATINVDRLATSTNIVLTLPATLNVTGDRTLTTTNANGYSLTMGDVNLSGGNLTVTATPTTRFQTITESGGSRKITKAGTGLVVLQGTSNHSGGTDILNGALQYSVANAWGNTAQPINLGDTAVVANSADVRVFPTLTLPNDILVRSGNTGTSRISRDNSGTAGTATIAGTITLQKNVRFENKSSNTTDESAVLDITGKITGAFNIVTDSRNTNGTPDNHLIVLSNSTNDFGTGAADSITVAAGILHVVSDAAMGNPANGVTFSSANSFFRNTTSFSTARTFTFNTGGTLSIPAGQELTLTANNQIQGTSGFTKSNTGILTITGNNSARTLGTTITGGTLQISSSNNIGTASPVVLSGGTLSLLNDTGTVFSNNITTTTATNTINVDRAIGGSGTAQTHTVGTIAFSTVNTTLTTTNANDYSLTTGAVTSTVATNTITNSFTGAGLLTLPSFNFNSATNGTLTLGGVGTTLVSGAITQTGAGVMGLTKSGAGIATVVGPSSYTGATAISGGTLRIPNATALPAATTVTVTNSGSTLDLRSDTALNYSGVNIALNNSGTVINVDSAVGGSGMNLTHTVGNVSVGTTSNPIINGANGYGLNAGILSFVDSASLANNAPGTVTFSSATVTNAAAKTVTLRGTGNTVITGGISQAGAGVYTLTKLDSGSLTINAASTLSGPVNIGSTTVLGGTLNVGAAGAIPNSALTVRTGVLNMNGFNLNPTSITMGDGITGTSSVINMGGGTLTLGGNVTYQNENGFLGAFINGDVNLGGVSRTFTVAETAGLEPDITVNGAITDATGGIIKAGAGSLLLSGTTPNTFAGPVALNEGVLILGKTPGVNAIPGDFNSTPVTGHQLLKLAASDQIPDSASVTLNGLAGVGSTSWDLNNFNETIASLSTLNNQSAGSLVISTGTGTLTVNGNISIAGTSSAGTASVTLPAFTGNVIDGNLNLGGATRTFDVSAAGNATVSANITNGSIIKTGATSLILSGNNTFTAGVDIQAGTVDARSLTALSTQAVTMNGGNLTLRQNGDGTATPETFAFVNPVIVNANGTIIADRLPGGTGTTKTLTVPSLTIAGQTLTVTANNTYTLGVIAPLTLTAPQPFNVTAGTFDLMAGATDGGSGFGITKTGGGTINFGAATSLLGLTVTGGSVTGPGLVTLTDSVAPLTFRNNTLSGSYLLTAASDGPVVFDSTSNGTATLSGTLDLGSVTRSLTINNGSAGTDTNISGVLAGTAGWTKEGTGTLALTGTNPNTYTGLVTLNAGTVSLGKTAGVNALTGNVVINTGATLTQTAGDQIPDTSDVLVSGGTYNFGGQSETIANLTLTGDGDVGTGTGTPPATVTVTGTVTVSSNTAGNKGLAVNSGSHMIANKVIYNGGDENVIGGNSTVQVNTLTVGAGGLEFTGGQLKMNLGNTGALGSQLILNGDVTSFAAANDAGVFGFTGGAEGTDGTRTIDIGTGTRTFTVADGAAVNDMRIQYQLFNSGNVVKEGPGLLRLDGDNIYTGTTAVNAGTLVVNNTTGSGTGANTVTVAAGARLGGNGTITGLTTTSGGFAPGDNGIGTLNITNNVTWNAGIGSTSLFELGAGGIDILNPGTSDLLNITGDLTKGTGTTFTIDFAATGSAGVFKLIDWSGTSTFAASDFAGINVASGFAISGFTVDAPSTALYVTLISTGGPTDWIGAASSNWTAPSSWSSTVPNSNSAIANFTGSGGSPALLDANQQVNQLNFNAGTSYSINPVGSEVLSLTGTAPTISTAGTNSATQTVAVNLDLAAGTTVAVNGGTLELNSPSNAVLGVGVTATVATGATLSLGGTGNALSNGTSTHADVTNNGTLVAATAGKRVGNIDGSVGTTTVTATGATLTANHIRQSTLNIGAGNTVTVATNGGDSGTSVITNLSINATGKIDLTNNDLVVDNGNLTTLTAQLASGLDILGSYGSGPGINGITSSTFANDPNFNTVLGIASNNDLGYATFSGQTVDANDVLIKYTYYGDADLNGVVDGATDFDLYITGLTSGGSLGGWLFGDFDYNGSVDSATDFDLYITGLSSQGGPLLTGGGGNLVQAVPEPSTLVMGSVAMAGLAAWRLRKRRLASV